MPAPKDPVVEFIRWAATAPAHEVTLALRIIKALRDDPAIPDRPRRRRTKPAPTTTTDAE